MTPNLSHPLQTASVQLLLPIIRHNRVPYASRLTKSSVTDIRVSTPYTGLTMQHSTPEISRLSSLSLYVFLSKPLVSNYFLTGNAYLASAFVVLISSIVSCRLSSVRKLLKCPKWRICSNCMGFLTMNVHSHFYLCRHLHQLDSLAFFALAVSHVLLQRWKQC